MKGIGLVILITITSGVKSVPLVEAGGGLQIPTLEDSPTIAKKNKKKKKKPFSDVRAEKRQQQQQQPTSQSPERPARKGGVKWISVAVLFKFLLAFKSFAGPFLDPLGEPRRATE